MMATNDEGEKPKTSANPGCTVIWIAVMVIVLTIIFSFRACSASSVRAAEKQKAEAKKAAMAAYAATHQPAPTHESKPSHPTSGQGFASKEKPLRVWLKPRFAGIHSSDDIKCCLEGHKDICWVNDPQVNQADLIKAWRSMPEGWYIVTPFGDKETSIRWD